MKYLFTILLLSSILVKGQTKPIFNNNADEFEAKFIPYDTVTIKKQHLKSIAGELVELYDQYQAFNKTDTLHPHFHKYNDYFLEEICPYILDKCIIKRDGIAKDHKECEKDPHCMPMFGKGYGDRSVNSLRFYRKAPTFEKFIEYLRKK